MDLNIHFD